MPSNIASGSVTTFLQLQKTEVDQGITEDPGAARTSAQLACKLEMTLGCGAEGGEETQSVRRKENLARLITVGDVVDQVTRRAPHEASPSISRAPI